MVNERKVLVSALLKAEKDGFSNIVLSNSLNKSELSTTQKSFITSAFYGVIERKKSLDYVLNKFLKKPINKTAPYTAAVLRSAAYQIIFMDSIPNFAAINEAVKLQKRSKEQGNAALVNAVLRNISKEDFKSEIENNSNPEIRFSVNRWIYDELLEKYGKEKTQKFFYDSLKVPPVFARVNTLKVDSDLGKNILLNLTDNLFETDIKDFYGLEGAGGLDKNTDFLKGLFFIQDYSSRIAAATVNAKPDMRVLDTCAAPGGKTFSIAIDMQNKGEIIAADLHSNRVNLIKDGADRLGLEIVKPTVQDATVFNEKLGLFDRVLCDLLCSGIGVIRRKPEIKYKTDEECLNLISFQKKILETSSKYVKKGGLLVYSTCTLLKRENEDIVEDFLSKHTDFKLGKVYGSNEGYKTFLPPQNFGDGFFVAALERL